MQIKLSKEDAFHLNVGVPFVLTAIFWVFNSVVFLHYFIENYFLLLSFYFVSALSLFFLSYLYQKHQLKSKTFSINYYTITVLGSFFVSFFLFLNIHFSTTIFETSCDVRHYANELKQHNIPQEWRHYYKLTDEEWGTAYREKRYYHHLQISKSFGGYTILKDRSFRQESF